MTTTVVKTIGSAGGRDYATIQAWDDDAPPNLVTADQVWEGDVYNDSELVISNQTTIFGSTTDATRHKVLTAAAGQSIYDSITTPAKYNATLGAAARSTVGYAVGFKFDESYLVVKRMQFQEDNTGHGTGVALFGASSNQNNITLDSCLFWNHGASGFATLGASNFGHLLKNCAIISAVSGPGIAFNGLPNSTSSTIKFCSIMSPSDISQTSNAGISVNSSPSSATILVQNTAIFGFPTAATSTNNNFSSSCDYNATDQSSTGMAGSHNQTSIAYTTATFKGTTLSVFDARLASGGGLNVAGNADGTITVDAYGQTHASPPSIGLFQFIANVNTATLSITQADMVVALVGNTAVLLLKIDEIIPGLANKTGVDINVWPTATPHTNRGAPLDTSYNQTMDSNGHVTLATPNCLAAGANIGTTGYLEVINSTGSVNDLTSVVASAPVLFKRGP